MHLFMQILTFSFEYGVHNSRFKLIIWGLTGGERERIFETRKGLSHMNRRSLSFSLQIVSFFDDKKMIIYFSIFSFLPGSAVIREMLNWGRSMWFLNNVSLLGSKNY